MEAFVYKQNIDTSFSSKHTSSDINKDVNTSYFLQFFPLDILSPSLLLYIIYSYTILSTEKNIF